MPLGSFESENGSFLAYFLASAFWLFFILGFLFLLPVNVHRKKDRRLRRRSGIAFFSFFRNKPAAVFDIFLIIGIIMLVVSLMIIRTMPGWVTLAGTFITVFSLEMHGLFNGKNYEYIQKTFNLQETRIREILKK